MTSDSIQSLRMSQYTSRKPVEESTSGLELGPMRSNRKVGEREGIRGRLSFASTRRGALRLGAVDLKYTARHTSDLAPEVGYGNRSVLG